LKSLHIASWMLVCSFAMPASAQPQPPQSASPQAASGHDAASTSAPASAADAAQSAKAAPPAQSAEEVKKAHLADLATKARSVGLRPKTKKGDTVYCRNDASTGTLFVTEKCFTEDQVLQLVALRNETHDEISRAGVCAGGASCIGH